MSRCSVSPPPQNIHLDLRHSVFDSAHVQKMRPLSFPEITSVTSGFRGHADVLPQKGSDRNERSGASVGSALSHGVPPPEPHPHPHPRRVALIFRALSGTNLLATCHSPTGSQLKCYDWNRWFWVGSLAPRLAQKGAKVDQGVIVTSGYRLASCSRLQNCAEATVGFRSRFAFISR